MNSSMKRLLTATATVLVVAAMLSMTACFKPTATSDISVEPLPDNGPTEPTETRVTAAVPEGQLSITMLMTTVDSHTAWSELSPYTHTIADDGRAVFAVMNSNGKECTLTVTFDEATDTVSEALLSYKDRVANILSDDNTVEIRTVMVAMEEE